MYQSYYQLNNAIVLVHWPILHSEACLDRIVGHNYYLLLIGFSGYFVVEMEPTSRDYTAFITPFGRFRYTVTPFGVKRAPLAKREVVST